MKVWPIMSAIDQRWECPRCGSQVGMGAPAQMRPPKCQWGHAATEMEQVTCVRAEGAT